MYALSPALHFCTQLRASGKTRTLDRAGQNHNNGKLTWTKLFSFVSPKLQKKRSLGWGETPTGAQRFRQVRLTSILRPGEIMSKLSPNRSLLPPKKSHTAKQGKDRLQRLICKLAHGLRHKCWLAQVAGVGLKEHQQTLPGSPWLDSGPWPLDNPSPRADASSVTADSSTALEMALSMKSLDAILWLRL